MRVGSLFTGIGGMDLGLEWAGMQVIWMCECDNFARKILKKHWPQTYIYKDIRSLNDNTPIPDMLCGGFPCTDLSVINTKGKGLDGKQSGLWFEYLRVIRLQFGITNCRVKIRRSPRL
jgi:DNA (cytosine-5)-methyltransferase 1